MSKKGINSHIQIPAGILKYFRDNTSPEKKVWSLDTSSGKIIQRPYHHLGTQAGYYALETELFWNKTVESSITKLNNRVRSFCKGETTSITVTPEDLETVKRYIKASMLRSGLSYDMFRKHSVTAFLFSDQENRDAMARLGMGECSGAIDTLLEGFRFSLLVNKTSRHLVVPRNCFYWISSYQKTTIVVPISPQGALLLLPKDHPSNPEEYAMLQSPKKVEWLNIAALRAEYYQNKAMGSFVAADREEELLLLQIYREQHLSELESIRADAFSGTPLSS